jgi:hypothetical protein
LKIKIDRKEQVVLKSLKMVVLDIVSGAGIAYQHQESSELYGM